VKLGRMLALLLLAVCIAALVVYLVHLHPVTGLR